MTASLAAPWLVGLIATALIFDFLNGLHDAANSIATIVSTRILRPSFAVFWASFFNFIAFLFFGLTVAETVGKGILDPETVTSGVIFAALFAAIVWNVVTWLVGIPSSSSHALIGGLVGAGVARSGFKAVVWSGSMKTTGAIVLSPLLGFALALVLVAAVHGSSSARRHSLSENCFGRFSLARRRSIRLVTAATTPRRRWVSSRCSSSRRGICRLAFMSHCGSFCPVRLPSR